MNNVGTRIKTKREEKKLSIEKIAKKMKTDPATVSAWESGEAEIDTKSANRLASILSVTTDYLLFGIDSAGGLHTMFPSNTKPEPAGKGAILAFISAMLMFIGLGGIIMLIVMTAARMDLAGHTGFFQFFILTGTVYSAGAFLGIAVIGAVIGIISIFLIKNKNKKTKRVENNESLY